MPLDSNKNPVQPEPLLFTPALKKARFLFVPSENRMNVLWNIK